MTLPTINPSAPSAVLGFGVTAINGTMMFSWDTPAVLPAGTRYRIVYAPTSLSDASSKIVLCEGADTSKTLVLTTNSMFWYQVQAFINSANGPYAPSTYGIGVSAGIPSPPPATGGTPWGVTVSPSNLSKSGTGAQLTTATAAIAVTGSAAPVFSWAPVSSVNIIANSPGAPLTTFSARSMTVDEIRNATFRCTVTDSGGVNSYAPTVNLYFERYAFGGGGGGGGGSLP